MPNGTVIKKVVIAGGGTAGWLAAAALAQQLGELLEITLVESEEIGTIGVGESTVPPLRTFHKLLRIDEQEFMRACSATFKLGIQFDNWGKPGERYVHPFGRFGKPTWLCEFHHFWLRSLENGGSSELGEYCYEWQALQAGRFATSPQSEINYAYQLDASLYARFLRKFAEARGVRRVEGKIASVRQTAESGFIEALVLASGNAVEGDLFIDCTGFRGVLIEQALHAGFEDWNHWLPCDSAVAVPTEAVRPPVLYTRCVAHDSGWRWAIPLQHRVGNGLVYSSRYLSDDEAKDRLLQAVEGKPLRQPFVLKFRAGRRLAAWRANCVAIGLSSGFVEPLESTAIHLIVTAVTRLMQYFPLGGITPAIVALYNDETRAEIEKIRDFVILHFHATQRDDSAFWRYCRTMEIPESLRQRIELFREAAHAYQAAGELFRVDSWVSVLLGQGIRPEGYHPAARTIEADQLARLLQEARTSIADSVARLPTQQEFIDRHCRVGAEPGR
ncbi:MAG TPA: tryptophan halogenase family protein [Steroidobacteraceae bacterium]|nr:tryptophan halogenase family protein [Steroidobacteraceae bacterium]